MEQRQLAPNNGPKNTQLRSIVDRVFYPSGRPPAVRIEVDRARVNLALSVWDTMKNGLPQPHRIDFCHRMMTCYAHSAYVSKLEIESIMRLVEDEIAATSATSAWVGSHEPLATREISPVHADPAARPVSCPFCNKKLPLSALEAEYLLPCGCGFGMLQPSVVEFVLDPVTKRDYVWRAANLSTSVYHPRRDDAVDLWRAVEKTKLREKMQKGFAVPAQPSKNQVAAHPAWAGVTDNYSMFWCLGSPSLCSAAGWTPIVWKLDPEIIVWHHGNRYDGVNLWHAAHIETVRKAGLDHSSYCSMNSTDPEAVAKKFLALGKPKS